MALNLTGLTPLDTTGLQPSSSPALDVGGLKPLDVGGLKPVESAAPPVQQQKNGGSVWDMLGSLATGAGEDPTHGGLDLSDTALDRGSQNYSPTTDYLARSISSGIMSALGAGARISSDVAAGRAGGALATMTGGVFTERDLGTEINSLIGLKPTPDLAWSPQSLLDRGARAAQAESTDLMAGGPQDLQKKTYANGWLPNFDPATAAWASPTRVIGDMLQSLPSTIAMAASLRFGGGAAARAYAETLAAGVGERLAVKAATTAAAHAIGQAGAASEGLIGYGQQANQTIEQVEGLPQDTLDKSPEYQHLRQQGFSPDDARHELARRSGAMAGFIAGAVDAVTNLASGPVLGKIIGGEGGNLLARTAKGFATEGLQEAVQSGGEQIGQNVAVQRADPGQSAWQDVMENVLQGTVVGGLTGGAGAAAFGHAHEPGVLESARDGVELTPDDHASPIPDDLIRRGKEIMAQTAAAPQAHEILSRNGWPTIGQPVEIHREGQVQTGTVADAFQTSIPSAGITDDGIKVQLTDGRMFEALGRELAAANVQIRQGIAQGEAAAPSAQAPGAQPPPAAAPAQQAPVAPTGPLPAPAQVGVNPTMAGSQSVPPVLTNPGPLDKSAQAPVAGADPFYDLTGLTPHSGEEAPAPSATKSEKTAPASTEAYDFKTKFPMPEEEGLIGEGRQSLWESEGPPDNPQAAQATLKAMHGDYSNEAQNYIESLQVARAALTDGTFIDGKKAKTAKQISNARDQAQGVIQSAPRDFADFLGAYAQHFGEKKADDFRDHLLSTFDDGGLMKRALAAHLSEDDTAARRAPIDAGPVADVTPQAKAARDADAARFAATLRPGERAGEDVTEPTNDELVQMEADRAEEEEHGPAATADQQKIADTAEQAFIAKMKASTPSWSNPNNAGATIGKAIEGAINDGTYHDALNPLNKTARATFEELTGAKLPKTISGTKDFLAKGAPFNLTADQAAIEAGAEAGSREAPIEASAAEHVDAAAERVAAPTEAQKDAGNYRKGHVEIQGLPITIETPKGAERTGVDERGRKWSVKMPAHYGYIKRTEGADGEHVDTYVGPNPKSERVWIVDQQDPKAHKFDEHKAFVGFDSPQQVRETYQKAFSGKAAEGRMRSMTDVSMRDFKDWLATGDTTEPFTYGGVVDKRWGLKEPAGENYSEDRAQVTQYRDDALAAAERARAGAASEKEIEHLEDAAGWADRHIEHHDHADIRDRLGEVKSYVLPQRKKSAVQAAQINIARDPQTGLYHQRTDYHLPLSGGGGPYDTKAGAPTAKAAFDKAAAALRKSTAARQGDSGAQAAESKRVSDWLDGLTPPPEGGNGGPGLETGADEENIRGEEAPNGRKPRNVRGAGAAASGEASAEGDRAAESERPTRQPRDESGGVDRGPGEPAEADAERGERAGPEGRATGEKRVRAGGERGAAAEPAAGGDGRDGDRAERGVRGQDYAGSIGGPGGVASAPVQRVANNIKAIGALIEAEREGGATAAQQRVIAGFTGWGAVPQVFDERNAKFAKQRAELKGLLTEKEWADARASTINAHYTPAEAVVGMWAGLRALGFEGGAVLEPGVGTGNFLTLRDPNIEGPVHVTGIELDPITARIAKQLHPSARIYAQGFEETDLPANSFDAVIGNVPFANVQPFDKAYNKDRSLSLHNYFIVKSLHLLKPGGVMAVITSRYTMDARSSAARLAMSAAGGDLLGAIRMPESAFKADAGTEVVADILVFRKRAEGEKPNEGWLKTKPAAIDGEKIDRNEYFAAHPDNIIGTETTKRSMRKANEYTVVAPAADVNRRTIGKAFADIVARAQSLGRTFTAEANGQVAHSGDETYDDFSAPPADIKDGGFFVKGGAVIHQRIGSETQVARVSKIDVPKVKALISIRDSARQVLDAQKQVWDGDGKAPWADAQRRLNQAYDNFVKTFGPINKVAIVKQMIDGEERTYRRYPNLKAFRPDPDVWLVSALERFDEESGTAAKSAIMSERVVEPSKEVTRVDTPEEALVASMNLKGGVDLPYMARLLGETDGEAVAEKLQGRVYKTPGGTYQLAEQYLSGDVRAKLREAEAGAKDDKALLANVKALREVQPEDLKPSQIDVRMGAGWIPSDDVEAFLSDLLDTSATVNYRSYDAAWTVNLKDRFNVANRTTWGVEGADALRLVVDALNQRQTTITYVDSEGHTHTDIPRTVVAQEKQQQIKQRFSDWVWKDAERAERLARFYNDNYNNLRTPKYDGGHLTLPGSSNSIKLRSTQLNAIWRGIIAGNTLLDHTVGAGKTYTMVAIAMEKKRLGIAHKPMISVPNHMLEQFSREALQLYPAAQIIVADKDNFTGDNRRRFVARVAAQNWDIVVMTHAATELVPMSAEFQAEFIRDDITQLEALIRESSGDRVTVKELERSRASRTAKLKALIAAKEKDRGLAFEDMGVDDLSVDEAHLFKNLEFQTKTRGIAVPSSQRAFDLYMKTRYLDRLTPGRGVIFATGTPIANSMSEMFTMQRYLDPLALAARGLSHFDAWAAAFGDMVTQAELSPDGAGARLKTRFAQFRNIPELVMMYRQFADFVSKEDLKRTGQIRLPVAHEHTIIVPPTRELQSYIEELGQRAEAVRARLVDPTEDNMLKISSDGRHAALDMRLVMPHLPASDERKSSYAARNIIDVWKRTTSPQRATEGRKATPAKAAQLVFLDLSTPGKGKGFNVYDDLREQLIRGGIPAGEIAYIHDADSDDKKAWLFADVRAGRKRVLMGSTEKMGVGTNVQERLAALHHIDAPWRPSDLEQRDGRIERQGNLFEDVDLSRYVTEASFDAYMWQGLERKAKFINSVKSGDPSVRIAQDIDQRSLSYAEVKALATGNPLIMEKAKVDQAVMTLARVRNAHSDQQQSILWQLRALPAKIEAQEAVARAAEADIKRRDMPEKDAFAATISGAKFTERAKAAKALGTLVRQTYDAAARAPSKQAQASGGEFAGFKFDVITRDSYDPQLIVHGAKDRAVDLNLDTAETGALTRLENALRALDNEKAHAVKVADTLRKDVKDLEAQKGRAFDREDEYQKALARQKEIDGELLKAGEDAAARRAGRAARIGGTYFAQREADRLKVVAALQAQMKRFGIEDKVALNVVDKMRDHYGEVYGFYLDQVMDVALTSPNPIETLRHETIHALKNLGLFKAAEWTSLVKAAQADTALYDEVATRYADTGIDKDMLDEEAVAEMFARSSRAKAQTGGFFRAALERVQQFFKAVSAALKGSGVDVDAVFQKIEAGTVGARPLPDAIDSPGPAGLAPEFMASASPNIRFARIAPATPTPPREPHGVEFANAASEARFKKAGDGAGEGASIVQRMRDAWDTTVQGFSRHWINLPNVAKYAELQQQLRKLEAAPSSAKDEIVRMLRGVVDGLTPNDLDLFTRKVVLDDLSWEVDQNHNLPFGLAHGDVLPELRKVDGALAARPDVLERVRQRKLIVREVADRMVAAGVIEAERMRNPAYYRHQVLDYANGIAQGTNTQLKKPRWAARLGSTKDINANYLEAEFDWLHKALIDVATADTIKWIKGSVHNVRDQVIAAARAHNDRLITTMLADDMRTNGAADSRGRQTSPMNDVWNGFKQKIGMGLAQIRKAAEDGLLSDVPPELAPALNSLGAASTTRDENLFDLLNWIIDNDKPGKMGALTVYKAISARRDFVKNMLGKQYADARDIADLLKRGFGPQDHVTWQPDEGKLLYTAKTLPEHVLNSWVGKVSTASNAELASMFGLEGDNALKFIGDFADALRDASRDVLAIGGQKYEMVLPAEVAATLNSLRETAVFDYLKMLEPPLKAWKQWVLINPRRLLKYNLNNLSGDLDAVIAGNPHALRHTGPAIKELYAVMKGGKPSARYLEAIQRGVFDSGITMQEVPDINALDEFAHVIDHTDDSVPRKFLLTPLAKVWRASQKYTTFRENWLRYAAYLDYVARIEKGEPMTKIGYGASMPWMVDAITDNKDRAALLARDLLGDYGNVSAAGQQIRRTLIPFYSWMEINTARYRRLLLNGFDQGVVRGAARGGALGATLGLRTTAYLTMRAFALYALVQLWNNLLHGDDEGELDPTDRAQLHLILGKWGGQVHTLRIQGAVSDALSWFGLQDAVGVISEIAKGRAGLGDLLTKMVEAPVNKVVSGLTPLITEPVTLLSGEKFYPDVFNPRSVRDTWREIASVVSLENEYDWLASKPSRGYLHSIEGTLDYSYDPGENAYNRVRDLTYRWLAREKGESGGIPPTTDRSKALYDWRMAVRYKDKPAEKAALERLKELHVDFGDRAASLQRMHPLGALALKDRGKFMRTLSPAERTLLDEARTWYRDDFMGEAHSHP